MRIQVGGVKIGGVESRTLVYLAPVSGVTDLPFRTMARSLGADIVGLNFDYPARKAAHKLCGLAPMRDLDRALAIVGAVMAADLPVTAKMYTGRDDDSRAVTMATESPDKMCAAFAGDTPAEAA